MWNGYVPMYGPLKKILDPGLVIFGFKMRKICVLVPRKIIMYGI